MKCESGSAETGGEKDAPRFSADEQRKIAQTQACMDSVGEKWVHPERYSEYERNMGLLFAWEWDNGGSMRDCEFAEVIAAAVQRASTFRRPSQNQTASSGVEGAHEGTTADESGCGYCGKPIYRLVGKGFGGHLWIHAGTERIMCEGSRLPAKPESREPEKLNNAQQVPFSFQAVLAGHWEFYHDDDCGAVLDPDTKLCAKCGWRPDLQSMGARRTRRCCDNGYFSQAHKCQKSNPESSLSSPLPTGTWPTNNPIAPRGSSREGGEKD